MPHCFLSYLIVTLFLTLCFLLVCVSNIFVIGANTSVDIYRGNPCDEKHEWSCVVVQQLVVICQQNNDVTMHTSSTPVVTLDEIETV